MALLPIFALVYSTFAPCLGPLAPGPVLAQAPPTACAAPQIDWSPGRRLRIRDFRSPERVPGLSAEANTGIGARSSGEPGGQRFRITVTSFFDPCGSWMREGERNDYTLAHEQLHFDITELHARKLAARYVAEVGDHASFMRVHSQFYEDAWAAARAMQVEYDSEVYGDREAQARWGREVAAALAEYEAYASKVVVLPLR